MKRIMFGDYLNLQGLHNHLPQGPRHLKEVDLPKH